MAGSPYDRDLDRNPANFQPLTPLTFLERAAAVFPERIAIVHGRLRRNYADFYLRSRRLASALAKRGVKKGDTVSVMLANSPAMLECHYGVPMIGAVLNTLNTRLDAPILAFTIDHAEAKVLIVDREFSGVIKEALALCKAKPLIIDYDDEEYVGDGEALGEIEYETFIAHGDPNYEWTPPEDEWDAISLNYTSGTTGDPKGVVYHHRGAHLLAMGNVLTGDMGRHPVYLWTLPMFHCNGWCFPWSISVAAGTHVCLRQVRAGHMYELMAEHGGHAFMWGADRDVDIAERHRKREASTLEHRTLFHRRRTAATSGARSDEGRRFRGDASLRPYRNLWPGRCERMAGRMG